VKAKTTIDKIEAVDKGLDILNPVPHSNEPRAASEGYDILAMIDGYENEGRKILKDGGYPLTVNEIMHTRLNEDGLPLGIKSLPRRVRDVMAMLQYFNMVRFKIEEKDISFALCFMAYGVQAAMKARIRHMEPDILRGRSSIEGASRGGQKKKEIDQARHDQWKLDAGKIKEKHPSFTPWRIAGDLVIFYKNNPKLSKKQDTIWRVIK